ncbi:MAG: efflux RND transporter periplasmic adaptor subunit [Mariprofundaceae bacterium]|nr:efflux RND transporter periplasmic adaptor subunit [Mariprofundaceae bacterium]
MLKVYAALAACLFISLPAIASDSLPSAEEERLALFSPDQQHIDLRGHLQSRHKATLAPEMAARIQKISVSEGSRFRKGQLLFAFNCDVEKAELERAKAVFDAANERLSISEELVSLNSISQLEMATVQAEAIQTKAGKHIWEAKVKRCNIYAPYAGRVATLNVHTHEYVQVGQPLLEILDDRHLEIEVLVPSSWLKWLKKGHVFSVLISETNTSYEATVKQLGARIDPVSQTLKMVGLIKGKYPELLSGMSGKVQIQETVNAK